MDGTTRDEPKGATPEPRLRVLLVEDDLDTLEMFARVLKKIRGVEVAAAANCASARFAVGEIGGQGAFDVIVADARLPDGNGVETAAAIRRDGFARGVVIVSGDPRPAALAEGVDVWLLKPVPVAALREAVVRVAGLNRGIT